MTRYQARLLPGGRLHLHDGPIDLIIDATGRSEAVGAAYHAAEMRFATILDELCGELLLLRQATAKKPESVTARRMWRATLPFAHERFITPMAAVAGSVAQEIVAHFARPGIRRAWVNNGGDIALWLADGASVDVGMVTDLAAPSIDGRLRIADTDAPRGIATSGWRGRSFSLGVADAVTVLADTAAMADAAATLIANAVDVDHPAVQRAPASSLRDDSDLGERLVTVSVGALPADAVAAALGRGERFARRCIDLGLVSQAMLSLQGRSRIVADHRIEALA
jgi:ApbE superfamily uncharacterized protein (UPF0280 family)